VQPRGFLAVWAAVGSLHPPWRVARHHLRRPVPQLAAGPPPEAAHARADHGLHARGGGGWGRWKQECRSLHRGEAARADQETIANALDRTLRSGKASSPKHLRAPGARARSILGWQAGRQATKTKPKIPTQVTHAASRPLLTGMQADRHTRRHTGRHSQVPNPHAHLVHAHAAQLSALDRQPGRKRRRAPPLVARVAAAPSSSSSSSSSGGGASSSGGGSAPQHSAVAECCEVELPLRTHRTSSARL
jgi:hypothetical protein